MSTWSRSVTLASSPSSTDHHINAKHARASTNQGEFFRCTHECSFSHCQLHTSHRAAPTHQTHCQDPEEASSSPVSLATASQTVAAAPTRRGTCVCVNELWGDLGPCYSVGVSMAWACRKTNGSRSPFKCWGWSPHTHHRVIDGAFSLYLSEPSLCNGSHSSGSERLD